MASCLGVISVEQQPGSCQHSEPYGQLDIQGPGLLLIGKDLCELRLWDRDDLRAVTPGLLSPGLLPVALKLLAPHMATQSAWL